MNAEKKRLEFQVSCEAFEENIANARKILISAFGMLYKAQEIWASIPRLAPPKDYKPEKGSRAIMDMTNQFDEVDLWRKLIFFETIAPD